MVELERGLAGEAEAHDVARNACHVGVDVAEELRRIGQAGALQQLPGQRPRDVDRGEGHRLVEDVDAEAPRLDPVADPHLGVRRAARREAQDEPRLAVAQDHPVVDDVAALVEQQRVPRPADLDVRDVARIEPLEELDDVGARNDQLAERADVAERDRLADRPVLGDVVAVVPRPPPAAEPIHAPTQREVLVVEGRPPEGIDVGVGRRLRQGDLARRRPGRERRGDGLRPGGDPRPDVGEAGAALARPDAGEARPLEELELAEAAIPGALKILDGRAGTGTDDAVGGRRRQVVLLGRGADLAYRRVARHPGEQVARRSAEAQDDRVARGRRFRARFVSGDDGTDAPLALEADEAPLDGRARHAGRGCPDRDRRAEIDAGRVEALRRVRGQESRELVAGTDGVDLGGAGRDDDLAGSDVEHSGRRPGDDRRPRVDRDDLLARGGVEEEHVPSRLLGRDLRPLAARAATDDHEVHVGSLDGRLSHGRCPGHVRIGDGGKWRHLVGRVAPDGQPRSSPDLAAPDVGDPVDLDEAVAAIAGEAQRPALGW